MVLTNVCKCSNAVVYSQGCTVASILDPMTRFEVVLIDNKGKFIFSLVSVSLLFRFLFDIPCFIILPFLHGGPIYFYQSQLIIHVPSICYI
jgi:hypothetical protein